MGDPPSYDPYLLEAARVLNNTDAKVKHIVFLGDGDAIYEANQGAVAANMKKIRDMGITVSTIVTGADNHESIKFMATMAYVGGGQSYIADKPQDLPRLLLKDQQTISQPPIIEEPFQRGADRRRRGVQGDRLGLCAAPARLQYQQPQADRRTLADLASQRPDLRRMALRAGARRRLHVR